MMFILHDVSYGYRQSQEGRGVDANRLVLDRVSLSIPGEQATAIVGRSGVGKSTLLYLLGLLWEGELSSGDIWYHSPHRGQLRLQSLSAPERADIRRNEFGFLMQAAPLLPSLRCLENVSMPLVIQGMPWEQANDQAGRLIQLADEVFLRHMESKRGESSTRGRGGGELWRPLYDLRRRWSHEVSGGERKRLALLRAIVHDPQVVFADEPLGNLDDATRRAVVEILSKWQQGQFAMESESPVVDASPARCRTLVVVTHDLEPLLPHVSFVIRFADDGAVSVETDPALCSEAVDEGI